MKHCNLYWHYSANTTIKAEKSGYYLHCKNQKITNYQYSNFSEVWNEINILKTVYCLLQL